ncbi:HNH endonuclease [Rubrimonas cliftonensis]|uniref:Putative restriction endonuclease n=1 Tax=Rubrimonas cliftonensis TaxID=89524 RepID=A0A1H4F806_9RHOB|nr:HNH endonuclease [Rubrimonas cliftonensis]SEA93379.1 putative restriction endonuclease [Rubrimonas cliftonensis]
MAHAVFTHADGSIYDDHPEERYHFPRTYLNAVRRAEGDWIVYYEPRRAAAGGGAGRQVYFAVARVVGIERDPRDEGHFYARMADYLPFPSPPGFREGDAYLESLLRRADGATNKGAFGRSVRDLPAPEFDAICALGFSGVRPALGPEDWAQDWAQDASPGLPEPAGLSDVVAGFDRGAAPRRIVEQLVSRPFREAAFARQVKAAYGQTCALTGLRILNGGGRPEVQAAHIRPVHHDGPDTVRNGLALSGTAHWMFDRGLVSVDDDLSILVARDRLPAEAARLLNTDGRLRAPPGPALRPHPRFLAHHREAIFKG